MCGIVAVVGEPDPITVRGMTAILAHRGPDGSGVVCPPGAGFGLGNRRLSILDLSPAGAQPMSDPSGRFLITYNGEVYNFRELRADLESRGRLFRSRSDTEVVLAAFEQWGPACLDRFNGMFAFAIWDRERRELFAARDRLGIKPLYWTVSDGTLFLASEIKAILATGRVPVEADPEVTHNPWHYPTAPRTGFKGIHKLPPGHSLVWKNGKVTLAGWWQLQPTANPIEPRHAAEELAYLIEDAVRLQMIADVPVGAMLSGGLDSSAIVALMGRFTSQPVRTFSISFRESDRRLEAMPDDHRFARLVAEQLGCIHREIQIAPNVVDLLPQIIWHLDEPLFDPAAINTFLIAKEARASGVPVLLNGMGADEMFGGYRKHYACVLAGRYQTLLPTGVRTLIERAAGWVPVAGSSMGFRTARWVKRFLSFASLPPVDRHLRSDLSLSAEDYSELYADAQDRPFERLAEVATRRAPFDRHGLSYLTQMCLADTTIFLPDHNLLYVDKATMAAGVEARPPLIDHRIVEFAFRLPDHLRISGTQQKALLRNVTRRWLPRFIVRRPKASFGAPLRAWIRNDLREMVDDLLSPAAIRNRGLFRPGTIQSRIEADRDGREDHAHFVWNLLCRELWFREFVDGGGSALRSARTVFGGGQAAFPPVIADRSKNGTIRGLV